MNKVNKNERKLFLLKKCVSQHNLFDFLCDLKNCKNFCRTTYPRMARAKSAKTRTKTNGKQIKNHDDDAKTTDSGKILRFEKSGIILWRQNIKRV